MVRLVGLKLPRLVLAPWLYVACSAIDAIGARISKPPNLTMILSIGTSADCFGEVLRRSSGVIPWRA